MISAECRFNFIKAFHSCFYLMRESSSGYILTEAVILSVESATRLLLYVQEQQRKYCRAFKQHAKRKAFAACGPCKNLL